MIIKNNILLGNLIMMAALVIYVISDTICKDFLLNYSVAQVSLFRTIARVIPILLACVFIRKNPIKTQKLDYHLLRSIIASTSTIMFILAYKYSPMTNVHAISYTCAFFILLFSRIILGEKVRNDCIIAVCIGLIGTSIIIRPDFQHGIVNIGGIFALTGAIFAALNSIMIRKLTSTEHIFTIMIYHNITLLILSAIGCIFDWKDILDWHTLITGFLIVGTISAISQSMISYALSITKSSDLAASAYVTIIPVVLTDIFYWKSTPDVYVIAGMIMVVICNYIVVKKH